MSLESEENKNDMEFEEEKEEKEETIEEAFHQATHDRKHNYRVFVPTPLLNWASRANFAFYIIGACIASYVSIGSWFLSLITGFMLVIIFVTFGMRIAKIGSNRFTTKAELQKWVDTLE